MSTAPLSSLSAIVDKMAEVLISLHQIMQAEHLQLSAEEINGSFLQRITEEKSSLLATLDYLEQQRQHYSITDHNENAMLHWQQLHESLVRLRNVNQHNGWLLETQLAYNSKLLQLLQSHQETGLYGANGRTASVPGMSKKFLV